MENNLTEGKIESTVIEVFEKYGHRLPMGKIVSHTTKCYTELGMDSLDMLVVIESVEEQLGVLIDTSKNEHLKFETVGDLVNAFKGAKVK